MVKNKALDTREYSDLSHYKDHVVFFYGKISAAIASLVTFLLTEEQVFIATTMGMLVIILADVGNIREHHRLIHEKSKSPEKWRKKYKFLATAFMLTIGIWCFLTFLLSNNEFLHLLCVTLAIGNITNLVCRNFNSDQLVTLQIWAVGIPLILGIITYDDYRSLILLVLLIPILASLRDISKRLKDMFESVAAQSRERESFGMQLNEALESMSHGLLMFDDEMRLRVINHTARHILVVSDEIDCYGKKLSDIARSVDLQKPYVNRVRILENALYKRLQRRTKSKVFQVANRHFVELSIKLRDIGGCVLVIEDVSQRIKYQNRINELARYDDLTGLCNRNYFNIQAEAIVDSMPDGSQAAVYFFDLDDFKRINDLFGHEAGDYTLTDIAKRVKKILPREAVIGRYGGDEFVVFIEEQHCPVSFNALSDQLIETIIEPIEFNNQEMRIGSSIGVAMYPQDATNMERLLKLADLALYESKASGKNTATFFSSEMEATLNERLKMETELAEAVKQGDLELHFQPIISVGTQKPEVFEALTRWNRNGNSPVSPSVFIPLAEDLGLISKIGEWTLLEACRQCHKWPVKASVAVNVSAVQFQVRSIIESVRYALEETGLEPNRLEIEITETAVLNDLNHAVLVLEELSSMGVRISLDDFGTGYSSLSYLHKLPLDKLKIDKSFIDDINHSSRSQTLLKGITAMGKALDLKVVVEGIESQDQIDILRERYEVDYMQGYFFSKALPSYDIQEFFERFHETIGKPKINENDDHQQIAQA